jgi:hypothetical protein
VDEGLSPILIVQGLDGNSCVTMTMVRMSGPAPSTASHRREPLRWSLTSRRTAVKETLRWARLRKGATAASPALSGSRRSSSADAKAGPMVQEDESARPDSDRGRSQEANRQFAALFLIAK